MTTMGSTVNQGTMNTPFAWKQRPDGLDGHEDGARFDDRAADPASAANRCPRRVRCRTWA
jgi:hypothetical protein